MGTFLTIVLGGPAVFVVGWRLLRPTQAVIDAAAEARAAERQPGAPSEPAGQARRRDTDSYAAAVNFTTDVDNGVCIHHDNIDDDEAA